MSMTIVFPTQSTQNRLELFNTYCIWKTGSHLIAFCRSWCLAFQRVALRQRLLGIPSTCTCIYLKSLFYHFYHGTLFTGGMNRRRTPCRLPIPLDTLLTRARRHVKVERHGKRQPGRNNLSRHSWRIRLGQVRHRNSWYVFIAIRSSIGIRKPQKEVLGQQFYQKNVLPGGSISRITVSAERAAASSLHVGEKASERMNV